VVCFKVLSRDSPIGTYENNEKPQSGQPVCGRDSKPGPLEYGVGLLTTKTRYQTKSVRYKVRKNDVIEFFLCMCIILGMNNSSFRRVIYEYE
jgi:hypothetical protein